MNGHARDTFDAVSLQCSNVVRDGLLCGFSRFVLPMSIMGCWCSIYAYYDTPRALDKEIDNPGTENCAVSLEDKLAGYATLLRSLPNVTDNRPKVSKTQ